MMMEVSVHQEDVTMITLYTFNNRALEIQEAIKFDPYLTIFLKITLKGIIKLKRETENQKTSREKTEKIFVTLGLTKISQIH